jgi:hypothetical protein
MLRLRTAVFKRNAPSLTHPVYGRVVAEVEHGQVAEHTETHKRAKERSSPRGQEQATEQLARTDEQVVIVMLS